jgi:hypothetical protein
MISKTNNELLRVIFARDNSPESEYHVMPTSSPCLADHSIEVICSKFICEDTRVEALKILRDSEKSHRHTKVTGVRCSEEPTPSGMMIRLPVCLAVQTFLLQSILGSLMVPVSSSSNSFLRTAKDRHVGAECHFRKPGQAYRMPPWKSLQSPKSRLKIIID